MPTSSGQRWRRPYVTSVAVLVTVAAGVAQVAVQEYVDTLQRDPAGLSLASWWRVLTPLLVQSDGVVQFAVNVAALAVIGAFAEQVLSRAGWVLVYLSAGVLGQLLGYAWEPPGGGNSVAVFGLGGAVLVAVVRGSLPAVAAAFVVVLAGAQLGVTTVGIVGAVVLVVLLSQAARLLLERSPLLAPRVLGWGGLLIGAGLVVARDHHGGSLLLGAAMALPLARDPDRASRRAAG